MRNKKLLTSTIIVGTLLSVGTSVFLFTDNNVEAKALTVATEKDYNKLQKLAKQPGTHYMKHKKLYTSFIPGNNVEAIYYFKSHKLTGARINPGKDAYQPCIGTKNINGIGYFVANNTESTGKEKFLIPAEYCQVPYAYKLKSGHKTVYDYDGSLANAWNGFTYYKDDYGSGIADGIFTKENIIYSSHKDSAKEVTLDRVGQNTGKNQGFWIGKTPITFRVDGTNTYEDYYPLYNYDPSGELVVSYIKTEDLDQFEPATVTYNWLGTITKNHKFKPEDKKLDL